MAQAGVECARQVLRVLKMLPPFLPPIPRPQRQWFNSAEAYQRAMNDYVRANNQRHSDLAWHLAMLITIAGLSVALCVAAALFVIWQIDGWRGIAYAVAGSGLFWAAIVQVHNWLMRDT